MVNAMQTASFYIRKRKVIKKDIIVGDNEMKLRGRQSQVWILTLFIPSEDGQSGTWQSVSFSESLNQHHTSRSNRVTNHASLTFSGKETGRKTFLSY